MAFFTNKGVELALLGSATPNGGIANLATHLRLYTGASTPSRSGSGFVQVTTGNGYAPIAITRSDWIGAVVGERYQIKLNDKTVTATGTIANVAGAYITDAGGNVLAWWPRASPATVPPGKTVVLDDLTISG